MWSSLRKFAIIGSGLSATPLYVMKNSAINIIFFLVFYSSVFCQTNLLTGIVIDSLKREPLIGATINLEPDNYWTTTDINGEYNFKNLPIGTYQFICKYLGHQDYVDSINISDTSIHTIKNIELFAVYYPPVVFKDTVISGYYTNGFEYSGIRLCGNKNEVWHLEPNDSLSNMHTNLWLKVKDKTKLSSHTRPEIFITVEGKMTIQGKYINVSRLKRAFIVEKVLKIMLPEGNDCNNK